MHKIIAPSATGLPLRLQQPKMAHRKIFPRATGDDETANNVNSEQPFPHEQKYNTHALFLLYPFTHIASGYLLHALARQIAQTFAVQAPATCVKPPSPFIEIFNSRSDMVFK